MPRAQLPDLDLPEWLTLSLLCEGMTHGWAVVRELSPDGEIGNVWTVNRPRVYRAVEALVAAGLAVERGRAPGEGAARAVLAPTPAGRRAATRWLARPVEHVRDVRSELLAKLLLLGRSGAPTRALLAAQRAALGENLETLTRARPRTPVELWRRESARAVQRFLDAADRL
jgi:DNA-binding PadR family transcriptional regulator